MGAELRTSAYSTHLGAEVGGCRPEKEHHARHL